MRQRHSFFTVLMWLLVIMGALLYLFLNVRIDPGIEAFLPSNKQDNIGDQYAVEQARGGQGSRLLMLDLSGDDPALLAQASHQLVVFLDSHKDVYQVNNGERKLSVKERNVLFRYRYLLTPVEQNAHWNRDYLKSELNLRWQELSSTLPYLDKKLIPNDPTMAFRKYIKSLPISDQPQKYKGVWFTPGRSRAVLILYLNQEGYDSVALEALMSSTRNHLAASATNKGIELNFTGPGVFAYESRRVIENETQLFSIVAIMVILGVLFLFYRSFATMLLSALPLLVAIIIAMALTQWVYSSIYGITLAFGIILLGIGIDYPIHYFSHSRGEQRSQLVVNKIWSTIFLGMLTSSIGFSVMWFSPFEGLRQLGFFSITGLLVAALSTRWLLPVFPLMMKGYSDHGNLTLIPYRFLKKFRWILLLILVSIWIIFIFRGSHEINLNGLRQMTPVPEAIYKKDRELRQQLGVTDSHRFILLVGDSAEAVLQRTEELTKAMLAEPWAQTIQQLQSVSQMLPSQLTQKRRQKDLPEDTILRESLLYALQGLPFKQDVFDEFIADIAKSKQLPVLQYELMEVLLGDGLMRMQMHFLMQKKAQKWYSLVKLEGLQEPSKLRQWLKDKQYVQTVYLDVGETVDDLVKGFMYDIIEKSLYGLVLIVVVLLLALRSIRRTLTVILPVVFAITFTLSLLVLMGESLSLFHWVSMLLVLGIGIDYGLFMSRQESDADKCNTLHSLLVCVVSTTAVFMIISFSDILVLHAVGSTVAIGVFASFVFSVFFSLPVYKKLL